MWTAKNRRRYDRSALRYPSDLTDDEWAHVESLIPPARRGGNKRHVDVREVMNGIMYVLSTGCQWRAIPKDLPPRSTLFHYLDLWSYDGTLDRIHHALYVECREQGERDDALHVQVQAAAQAHASRREVELDLAPRVADEVAARLEGQLPGSRAHAASFRNTRTALWPPKPKLLLTATPTCWAREEFGT